MNSQINSSTLFPEAIRAAGLSPPDQIEPGKFYRFPGEGKAPDNRAGWCKLFPDGTGGVFGDFSTDRRDSWQAEQDHTYTPQQRAEFKRQIEEAKAQAEADEKARHEAASEQAHLIWASAYPGREHPYLEAKGIAAHGARIITSKKVHDLCPELSISLTGLLLVIPISDVNGKLYSLQFIDIDGQKRYLAGGRKRGGLFLIGKPEKVLCIAEGFATGASIHEATGYAVAVSFDAGNLIPVTKIMKGHLPDLKLVVCADDDYKTDSNPGLSKATEAAHANGAILAVPHFGSDRPEGATDFNDLHHAKGIEEVRHIFSAVLDSEQPACIRPPTNPEVTQVTGVQPSSDAVSAVTCPSAAEVAEVTKPSSPQVPGTDARPCFTVFDDWHEQGGMKYRPGVWYFSADKDGNPSQAWICSPLHISAITFDGQDNNFGRLLRFKNSVGRWREWAMPMELLKGAGDELRGELLAMGVEIDSSRNARQLLASYLQAEHPDKQIRCALQVGWCDDSYVLPDVVIGPKASGVIFQSGERGHEEHTTGGNLANWQSEIAARAPGNTLLTLALLAAFAGPLLKLCNAEGGGIHFIGDSSTGKTTLLEAACSVWGGSNYRRSWRATANGMEGAAALFNDCLLALDEISECSPHEVGAIVYTLGNGRGKQRSSRSGNARSVTRWRCFTLSSGERSLATTMEEGGRRAKAGQAVRLLDLPASRKYGAWDELHGLPSGTAFSDAIKRAAATHHGHAGRAFLEKLTRDPRDFCALLEQFKSLPDFSAPDGEGQDKRAAGRFALLGLAGELATKYGLTGWAEGEATRAAAAAFKLWRTSRGTGNDERREVVDRLASFLERHGDGRFSDADSNTDIQLRDRAGWWRDSPDGREYLLTSDGMREALKGFDFKRALDILEEIGAVPKAGSDGKRTKLYRIGGRASRLYPVQPPNLGDHHVD